MRIATFKFQIRPPQEYSSLVCILPDIVQRKGGGAKKREREGRKGEKGRKIERKPSG
jgi:hypothetical protein